MNELKELVREVGLSNQQAADILELSIITLQGQLYGKSDNAQQISAIRLKTSLLLAHNEVARKRERGIIPAGNLPTKDDLFSMAAAADFLTGLSPETIRVMRIINDRKDNLL